MGADVLGRALGQALQEGCKLRLTACFGLREDLLEVLPDGFDTEPLLGRDFLKTLSASKAGRDLCFRSGKTECLPQNDSARFSLFVGVDQQDHGSDLRS